MGLSHVLSLHSVSVDLILNRTIVSDSSVKRLSIMSHELVHSILLSLGSIHLLDVLMAGQRNSSVQETSSSLQMSMVSQSGLSVHRWSKAKVSCRARASQSA